MGTKSYSLNNRRNSLHFEQKGVQDQIKHTLEAYKFCSEDNENKYGVNYSFRSNEHEFTMVKQGKIASKTFDDSRCYIDKYKSVPWGPNPTLEWLRKQWN